MNLYENFACLNECILFSALIYGRERTSPVALPLSCELVMVLENYIFEGCRKKQRDIIWFLLKLVAKSIDLCMLLLLTNVLTERKLTL